MQNNITALNIVEGFKNNKIIKVTPGKYAKPAKLSSGQIFKAKTSAIMDKIMAIPTPVAETKNPEPAPQVDTPVQVATSTAPQATNVAPPVAVESPNDSKILDKAASANISFVAPSNSKDNGARRLKISSAVVTRTKNAFLAMLKNAATAISQTAPVPQEEVPEQPKINEEVNNLQAEMPINQEVAQPQSNEVEPPTTNEEVATPDSGFFLGQKLNTESIANEETEVTPPEEEVKANDIEPQENEENYNSQSEISREEKDERLNQILNNNQAGKIDIFEARRALEEIANRKQEINQLEKEMEEAKRIRETQNQELLQLLADAPKIIADLDKDKLSRTEELSNLRAEIIQYSDLLNQKRGFQENNIDNMDYDNDSYGKMR